MKKIFFIAIILTILFQGVFGLVDKAYGQEAWKKFTEAELKGSTIKFDQVTSHPESQGLEFTIPGTGIMYTTVSDGKGGFYAPMYNKEKGNSLMGVYDPQTKTFYRNNNPALTKDNDTEALNELGKTYGLSLNQLGTSSDIAQGTSAAINNPPALGGSMCFGFTSNGIGIPSLSFDFNACVRDAANVALQVGAWFLWAAGVLFNWTLGYSLNMGEFLKTMPLVDTGWVVFRDIANMIFIFVVLAIAIGTVLQVDSYNAKKLLVQVLITALLLNFSLFFTKVVIDSSNILALQFYKQIGTAGVVPTGNWIVDIKNNLDGGLSGAMIRGLGLTSIYQTGGNNPAILGSVLTGSNMIVIGIGGFILTLCTAFVFFAATFLFITRTVVLIFLMILSPLAFLARALPQTKGYFSKWLSTLLNQSFFAPLYMVLIWVVFKTVGANYTGPDGQGMNFAAFMMGGKDFVGTLYTFLIIIAFMIGSLLVAKTMGAYGGNFAREWAGKLSFGVAGWAGRNTIGRVFNNVSKSDTMDRWKNANYKGMNPLRHMVAGAQRGVAGAFEGGAKGSFDIRGVGGFGNAGGGLGKAGGVGGIQKAIEDDKKRRAELQKTTALQGKSNAVKKALKDKDDGALQAALYQLSDSEYADLGSEMLTNEKIIQHSKANQVAAVLDDKNEKLTYDQKEKIRGTRNAPLTAAAKAIAGKDAKTGSQDFKAIAEDITKRYRSLSPEAQAKLGNNKTLAPILAHMKDHPNDTKGLATKMEGLSSTKDGLKARSELLTGVKNAHVKSELSKLSTDEKSKLDIDFILSNEDVLRNLDADTLKAINERKDLPPPEKERIKQARRGLVVADLKAGKESVVKDLLKGVKAPELFAIMAAANASGVPLITPRTAGPGTGRANETLAKVLTITQLKDLADEGMSENDRQALGDQIRNTPGAIAFSHVKEGGKGEKEWI